MKPTVINYSADTDKVEITYKTKSGNIEEIEAKSIESAYKVLQNIEKQGGTALLIQEIRNIIFDA